MKSFFERLSMNMARWMQGRNGMDSFSNGLAAAGIIFLLLSIIPGLDLLSWLSLVCLLLAVLRCCSKNVAQRSKENAAYERVVKRPRRAYALAKKAWANRKTTKYFTCSGCGTVLTVPRGKGTLRVVCPKCKAETTKKS